MLQQHLRQLTLTPRGEGFTDITAALDQEIAASGLDTGIAVIACLHTSCSLTVNENADPRVLVDLAAFLRALVPVMYYQKPVPCAEPPFALMPFGYRWPSPGCTE